MSSYSSNSGEGKHGKVGGKASNKHVYKKWRAGVLGATGIVGQRLVSLLDM